MKYISIQSRDGQNQIPSLAGKSPIIRSHTAYIYSWPDHIPRYDVCTVFLTGKSPNIRYKYTVYIFNCPLTRLGYTVYIYIRFWPTLRIYQSLAHVNSQGGAKRNGTKQEKFSFESAPHAGIASEAMPQLQDVTRCCKISRRSKSSTARLLIENAVTS
jgi:hypothetical protein